MAAAGNTIYLTDSCYGPDGELSEYTMSDKGDDRRPILVLGAASILGQTLVRLLRSDTLAPVISTHNREPAFAGWRRVNLEDRASLVAVLEKVQPELVIHCGAVCDVEKCERWPAFARRVNVDSIACLVDVLPATTQLVYCSSDHVFGGGQQPFREDSLPVPISVYGRSRVDAERVVTDRRPDALILRMGPAIGRSLTGRVGHLDWLRYRHRRGLPISIVRDELRSVVWAEELAQRLLRMASARVRGIRHMVADRVVSRPELASFLDARFAIGARWKLTHRGELRYPHLGRVELGTRYRDRFAAPLSPVVPAERPAAQADGG